MRTPWLLALSCSWVILLVPSQARGQHPPTLGLKGGITVASASLDVAETFDEANRTGIVGGAFLNLDFGTLGFQPEIGYVEKGFEEAGTGDALETAYLEFAGLLKAGIPLVLIKPSVFAGLALGIESRCRLVAEDCEDVGFNTSSTDWSGVFGADVALYLGKISLWGDGRYAVGLTDIRQEAGVVLEDVKNRAWQFQVGIGFALRE